MLSDAAGNAAAAVIFEDDSIPADELAGCIREKTELSGGCIEVDIFTYGGRTLVIARPAAPLQGRLSAKLRIKRGGRYGRRP